MNNKLKKLIWPLCAALALTVLHAVYAPAANVAAAADYETPFVLTATDSVRPGDAFSVNGEFFGVGPVAEDTEIILAPSSDSPDINSAEAFKPEIVQRDARNGQYLAAILPGNRAGVFDLWVKTPQGISKPYKLNGPRPLFISEKEAWEGQSIDISGRNFDPAYYGAAGAPAVRLAPLDGGEPVSAELAQKDGKPDFNPYRIRFTVPAAPEGEYGVQVSAAGSGRADLDNGQTLKIVPKGKDPLGLGVAWADKIPWDNEFNVADYGANTGLADNQAAFQNAANAAKAAGGGAVMIPAGIWNLKGLRIPAKVAIVGAGKDKTIIEFCATGASNNINVFIAPENKTDGPGAGYNGLANLTIRNKAKGTANIDEHPELAPDIDERPRYAPDVYVELGTWNEGADALDYKGEGYFLKNVDILSGMTRSNFHDDGGSGNPAQQRGRGFTIIGGRVVVENVTSQTFSGVDISKSAYVRVENSSVTYANKQFNVLSRYSFIINVTAKGMRSYNPKENKASMHGFMCRDNIHFEDNDISGMGAYTNDGEIIGLEIPSASYGFGRLSGAAADSVTFGGAGNYDGQGADFRTHAYEFSSLAVVITDGRGKGQMRYVDRPSKASRTVTLRSDQKPFDVIPDSTSTASLMLPIERATIYNNRASDCAKGILFFGNNYDAVGACNILCDTDGMVAWAVANNNDWGGGRHQDVLAYNAFISFRGNSVSGASPRTRNTSIALTTGRDSRSYGGIGTYQGTQIYSVDIRGNVVTGDPSIKESDLIGNESETPLWQAVSVSSAAHSSNAARDNLVGDITNVLIQGNNFVNTRDGVHYSNCNDGMLIKDNRYTGTGAALYRDTRYPGAANINFTVYAGDTPPVTFDVLFDSKGGSAVPKQTIMQNNLAARPSDPIFEGYDFGGWYRDAGYAAVWNFNSDRVSGGMTLYAKWNPKTYTITFHSNGGSGVDPLSGKYGAAVAKPDDPVMEGYTFAGWYTDGGVFANEYEFTVMPLNGVTLYAQWDKNPPPPVIARVTFNSRGGSAVTAADAETGTLLTPPAEPVWGGYTFGGWFTDEECAAAWDFGRDVVEGDMTLYAKWTHEKPAVTPGGGCANAGAALSVIAALIGTAIFKLKIKN